MYAEKARYLEKISKIQEELFFQYVQNELMVVRAKVKSDTDAYNQAQLTNWSSGRLPNFAPPISKKFMDALKAVALTKPGTKADPADAQSFKDVVEKDQYFQWLKSVQPKVNLVTELFLAIKGRDPLSPEVALWKLRANHDPSLEFPTRRQILESLIPKMVQLNRIDRLMYRLQFEDTVSNSAWKYAGSADLLMTKRKELMNYISAVAGSRMTMSQHEALVRLFMPPTDRNLRSEGEYLRAYYLAKEKIHELQSAQQFKMLEDRAMAILARPEYRGKIDPESNFHELWLIYAKEPISYERALALRFLSKEESEPILYLLDSLNALMDLRSAIKDWNHLRLYMNQSGSRF